MHALITWILACIALFVASVTVALIAIVKKRFKMFIVAAVLFVAFMWCGVYTLMKAGVKVFGTAANKLSSYSVEDTTSYAKDGRKMYARLFDTCPDCVHVLAYQDAVVPIMDANMSLHVKTCPQEVQRILPKVAYTMTIEPKSSYNSWIPGDSVFYTKDDSLIHLSYEEHKANLEIYIARDSSEMLFCNWW